jgi:hypothetical protein
MNDERGVTYLCEYAHRVEAGDGCDAGECAEGEDGEECGFFAPWALDAEEDFEREEEYPQVQDDVDCAGCYGGAYR